MRTEARSAHSKPDPSASAPTPPATTAPDGAAPAAPAVAAPARNGLRRLLGGLLRERDDAPGAPYRDEDVTPVPALEPGERVVDVLPVRPPFSMVRVLYNEDRHAHRYEVLEPPLTEAEARAYAFLKDAFLRTLDVDLDRLDREGAERYLGERTEALLRRHRLRLDTLERARVGYYLQRDFLGYGPIDVLMRDPNIEDISCDGPGLPIFIYHRRFESVKTSLVFPGDEALDGFVMGLVQRSGKHISVAEPLVDATLPDGSRLQASLSREVTTRGSTFTIRKFRADPLTPTDLIIHETMSPEMMAYFWLAVEHGSSLLICGGTASGKTTSLNALSVFIPPQKKIVSIEDTREIHLSHENWIPGVTRSGGAGEERGDGKRVGAVDMFDLLKAALRQRPEYILLGEVRGAEAYVLFQAMATGHTVMSTMHADGVASAVHRLESKPIDVPRNMLASLDVVAIQADTRHGDRRVRRLRELVELTGIDPRTGELLTNRAFWWDPAEGRFRYSGASIVLSDVAEERRWNDPQLRAEFDRRVRVLTLLAKHGIRDIAGVSRVVASYAADPARALADLEEAERAR